MGKLVPNYMVRELHRKMNTSTQSLDQRLSSSSLLHGTEEHPDRTRIRNDSPLEKRTA